MSDVLATFQRGRPFFPKSLQWACSQWWLSFLFRNCATLQGALQILCLPASQSVSLITWGFHTLPDYNAYLPSTSPQLRCLQLEMTITCSVIVGCVFFPPQPPRWYFVGRRGWKKEVCVMTHKIREVVKIFHVLNNIFIFVCLYLLWMQWCWAQENIP